MGESPSEADIERVAEEYVDPSSADADEQEGDLKDAGFTQSAIDAFKDGFATVEDVTEAAEAERGKRGITTREDVERGLDGVDKARPGGSDEALVDEAAEQMAAPTTDELRRARGQAAQQVTDDGVLRSDPDLDPLAEGGEGREIVDTSEGGLKLGKEGGVETGVRRTGPGKGEYYAEDSAGNQYPLAEVDL